LAFAFACSGQASAQTKDAAKKPAPPTKAAAKTPAALKQGAHGVTNINSGTLVITGGGMGEFPKTLDQALTAALETSPKVMAAKARVTLAEAELSSAQMDVARKIVQLWTDRQTQQLNYEEILKRRNESGIAPLIIEAGAAVTQTEMELRCLIGQASAPASRGVHSNTSVNGSVAPEQPAKPLQLPRGPVVEKIRKALHAPTEINFTETPLVEVVEYLRERHKIEIQIDAGKVNTDWPITVGLNGVTLGEALQAIDDLIPDLKFVVRDYGILVTTPERARQQGYFPVVDFARLGGDGGVTTFEKADLRPDGNLLPSPFRPDPNLLPSPEPKPNYEPVLKPTLPAQRESQSR
jgi:hypothetical protein